MNTDKAAVRSALIKRIQALPEDYIKESDAGIFHHVKNLREFDNAQTIFSYYSLGREPDTIKIIEYALEKGKTVTLPVCFKGGIMEARAITSLSELSCAAFNLLEPLSSTRVVPPEELEFIIVPALTFDFAGYRLGRGGGYYDRFLPGTKGYTTGLARECLLCEEVPREVHDVSVRCVITEKKARLH